AGAASGSGLGRSGRRWRHGRPSVAAADADEAALTSTVARGPDGACVDDSATACGAGLRGRGEVDMNASGAVGIFRDAISDCFEDDAMPLGAALAYYTALSLAPLLVLLMWIAPFLGESRQQEIIEQAQALIGPQAGEAIDMVVQNAEEANARTLAGILGLITLLLGATGVFGQLQHALNLIWDVKA